MKGDFIINFLEGLAITVKDLNQSASRLSCKGFRVSSFRTRDGDTNYRKYYVGFKNLEHRKLIRLNSEDYYEFTNQGKVWLKRSVLRYFKFKHKKWDRKWRVIIFDIPEELGKERIKFRHRLKWLGCVMLQESVFVFPYPCEDEISDISRDLGVGDYIDFIVAESIGFKEEEFLNIFKLK